MDDIDLDELGCILVPIGWLFRLAWFLLRLPFMILKLIMMPFNRGRPRR